MSMSNQSTSTAGKRKSTHKSHSTDLKLEAIQYSKDHSIHKAANHFKVDRKTIREWRDKEKELLEFK